MSVLATEMSQFARTIIQNKYSHTKGGIKEEWSEIANRVVTEVVNPYFPTLVNPLRRLVNERKFVPGGRYLYSAGRKYKQVNNCFLFRAHDSREGWGSLLHRAALSLMTGGGIGAVYSELREENALINGMGGKSSGPCSLMQIVNEEGRHMMQGGARRSAIWAGLHWNHPDIFKMMALKNWCPITREGKRYDFNFPAPMDMTNISVILDTAFFTAFNDPNHRDHVLADSVYWMAIDGMCKTGEPGFSIDCDENEGENLRNACTEVTSADDDDMCNLASINLARINTLDEMREAVELGTAFLLCGTLYSQLPIESMYKVREKNRRLGLGLMGLHEWLIKRGKKYGPDNELGEYLSIYSQSGAYANRYADKLSISRPRATRAIAPTGTIAIAAETTSGCEPIYAVALKRRYLSEGRIWKAQYIVDPAAARLVKEGVDPDTIEDAVVLSQNVERRVAFQEWLQNHVDHGISSTINLPQWGSEYNNPDTIRLFGNTLLKYLPRLRGITAYPDGARDGQPLTRVPYREAIAQLGYEFNDGSEGGCKSGVCGV